MRAAGQAARAVAVRGARGPGLHGALLLPGGRALPAPAGLARARARAHAPARALARLRPGIPPLQNPVAQDFAKDALGRQWVFECCVSRVHTIDAVAKPNVLDSGLPMLHDCGMAS